MSRARSLFAVAACAMVCLTAHAQDLGAVKQTVVDKPESLEPALAVTDGHRVTDVIWLKLTTDQIAPRTGQALLAWVSRGGTLWTETDAARLFGFTTVKPTPREFYGHARRACAALASPLVNGVDQIWFHLDPTASLLTGHPNALPLLRVADSLVRPSGERLVAAELLYGEGKVIHRPAEIHAGRGDGKIFEANLKLAAGRDPDQVTLPVEALAAAQQRALQAQIVRPEDAKAVSLSVFLAYRLWWAEHLTTNGKYDEALAQLKGVSADLPEDPAVYAAVARWNERQNRPEEAAKARQKVTELYAVVKKTPPGPEARQVRVPWVAFVAGINAAGAAWDQPSKQTLGRAVAVTDYLLGLDSYRRADLKTAERLWQEAWKQQNDYAACAWMLGLTYRTWADDLRGANRQRGPWDTTAGEWFDAVASAPAADDCPPAIRSAARSWAETSRAAAAQLLKEPPDVLVHGGFVFRFDGSDRRLQVLGTFGNFQRVFDHAYNLATNWGVWLDPTEVLIAADGAAMGQMLPAVGLSRQAFGASATAGRRIFIVTEPTDLDREAHHEFARVVCNALTEGGFPPPPWFEVGLASLAEGNLVRTASVQSSLQRGQALNLMQLNDTKVLFDRTVMDFAFGQSELMVRTVMQRWGTPAVVAYLMDLGWGTSPDVAFQNLTRYTPQQFLVAWLSGRL